MREYDLRDIFSHFEAEGEFSRGAPIGQGHIHDTYMIEVRSADRIGRVTLQRINTNVFRKPELMMQNFQKITRHLRRRLARMPGHDPDRETLNLIPTKTGESFFRSARGDYWRAYRFVSDCHTVEAARTPVQAYQAGRAFGFFQKLLIDFPVADLHETIPFFHHTPRRLKKFLEVLEKDCLGRRRESAAAVSFALARAPMAGIVTGGLEDGTLPLRITHNDTKINNVLFDDSTGEAVCVLDLDTTMPGSALYDFGDMVRTTTCSAAEDERDLAKINLDMGMFESLSRGYLEEAGEFLTDKEVSLLVFSGRLITFTIGLRFLTDHLEGDVYFKIHRPGHNLERAKAQFALVESLEEREAEMNEVLRSLTAKP